MQTNLTESGPFERLLTVSIEEAELDAAKEKAARRLSRDLRVKGFRPGKAPRRIVEQMVGAERLRSEALEEALPGIVGDALEAAEIRPAVAPSVADTRDTASGIEVDLTVTIWPKPGSVPSYGGRRIVLESPVPTDEEVETHLDRVREQYAELERADRAATTGDYVRIDITTFRDGERVEEASATDLDYEVGSASFIDGLDEALTGSSAGDIEKFSTELPAGFGEHAGAEVELHVLVKEVRIKRLPDLTDEWVEETTGHDGVAELREEVEEAAREMKLRETGSELRRRLLDELLEEMDLAVPQALVDAEAGAIAQDFVMRLERQGIALADYLSITGQDEEALYQGMLAQADRNLRTRVLLEAIAEDAGVEVDANDVDEVIAALAQSAQQPVEQFRTRLVESGQIQALVGDMLRQKTIDRLVELAEPVDADGNPIDLAVPGEAAPDGDEVVEDTAGTADEEPEPSAATVGDES